MRRQKSVESIPKPPHPVQPTERPLDRPSEHSQAAAVFGPTSRQTGNDPADLAGSPQPLRIIGPVSEQLGGITPGMADLPPDPRQAVQQGHEAPGVVAVRPGITASGMPRPSTRMWCFDPNFRRSVGFGPVASPPPGDRTEPLSTAARDQSIWSAAFNRDRMAARRRSQTPSCCHCPRRSRQVFPQPQPSSAGRSS